jgi:DNA repair protein RadC
MNDQPFQYQNRIQDLEQSERPRERLLHVGPDALANYELLAILLRVGLKGVSAIDLAKHLLAKFGGLNGLRRVSFDQLKQTKGVGAAKAAQILAAIELGRRFSLLQDDQERILIKSSEDVYEFVRYEMAAFDHEELWVVNLDMRHRVLAIDKLYKGSLNSSPVRVAEVFQKPISRNTAAIILVHNHPKPSTADIAVTRSVLDAGKLLEIPMLDHLIIGHNGYESIVGLLT